MKATKKVPNAEQTWITSTGFDAFLKALHISACNGTILNTFSQAHK